METPTLPTQDQVNESLAPGEPPQAPDAHSEAYTADAPARSRPARPAAAAAPRSYRLQQSPHLALPALATAVLLYLCYFPVAWGWLGWVALVPLLSLARADASRRRVFFCAWLGGLAFFWPALQWMRVADYRMYYTWAMLATYCSLYFPVAILLIRRLDRGTPLPLVVTVPAVWVGLEFVRSYLLTGFSWYYLGHTQHDFLAVIQVSDLGGAYAVSLLVAAVNAWLFEALYRLTCFLKAGGKITIRGRQSPCRRLAIQGACVFGLLTAALIYGGWRLSESAFTAGPRVALLQGNLDQRLRNVASGNVQDPDGNAARAKMFAHLFNLVLDVQRGRLKPDLIVWPETSFHRPLIAIDGRVALDRAPDDWKRGQIAAAAEFREFAQNWCGVDTLLGLNTYVLADEKGKEIRYNSALLMHANGAVGGRYDKLHRVPFGEYVPFREWLPFMDAFAPYDDDYSISSGNQLTRFSVGKHRFGVLICFEDTDPYLARAYGRATGDGPPVDFLVNISNDGWFDGSSEHDEHLAISRFRAVEARRSLARAVNMGISAVIDGNGRVLAPDRTALTPQIRERVNTEVWVQDPRTGQVAVGAAPRNTGYRVELAMRDEGGNKDRINVWKLPWPKEETYLWTRGASTPPSDLPVSEWGGFKKTAGALVVDIPLDGRTSLYSLWGDWLAGCCLGLACLGWLWARLLRRPMTVGGVA